MLRKIRNNRGIVLITVLFMTVFLVMFASAVTVSTLRQHKVSSVFYQRQAAGEAAMAGINYAMSRLNAHYDWKGCSPGSGGTGADYTLDKAGDLSVREYVIDGNSGAVEGKLAMGDHTAYFDIYFVKPDDAKSKMQYFNNKDEAGPMPEWIPVSLNNNTYPITRVAIDSDNNNYREVPGNAILIVCRGRVGNQEKTVETLFNLNPEGNYDSVMTGKGNIDVKLNGGALILESGTTDKPPIVRSDGNIVLNQLDNSKGDDFLTVKGEGGARAKGQCVFKPVPPSNFSNTFVDNSGSQENSIPPLTFSNVEPVQSLGMATIPPGIYKIEPGETKDYPTVTYYPANDPSEIRSVDNPEGVVGETNSTINKLIDNGILDWDEKQATLKIKQSVKVSTDNNINNIRVISNDETRIAIKLDTKISKNSVDSVYFINNNPQGGIYVEGELSGIGTVICKGDIIMEAESQLAASDLSGISIYAEGSISIKEISKTPQTVDPEVIQNNTSGDEEVVNKVTSVYDNFDQNISDPYSSHLQPDGTYIFTKDGFYGYGVDRKTAQMDDETWAALKEMGLVSSVPEGEVLNVYSKVLNKVISYPNPDVNGSREYIAISKNKLSIAIANYTTADDDDVVKNKKGKKVDPKDSVFRGLVFTCKDFNVDTPNTVFYLEGGLVAHGSIPGGGSLPGDPSANPGSININAKDVALTYNTTYLSLLQTLGKKKIDAIYWTSW